MVLVPMQSQDGLAHRKKLGEAETLYTSACSLILHAKLGNCLIVPDLHFNFICCTLCDTT